MSERSAILTRRGRLMALALCTGGASAATGACVCLSIAPSEPPPPAAPEEPRIYVDTALPDDAPPEAPDGGAPSTEPDAGGSFEGGP